MTENFRVAGLNLSAIHSLPGSPFEKLVGFAPFRVKENPEKVHLLYDMTYSLEDLESERLAAEELKPVYKFHFEDEDIFCRFYVSPDESRYWFEMEDEVGGKLHFFEAHFEEKTLVVRCNWQENRNYPMLRFSLWMAFSIACTFNSAIAIHSSCIVWNSSGKAALFLGESGTGKSTHTRLYNEVFGAEAVHLLNDDCPIIKAESDGSVRVYGSPWSGKTPCYRNEDYALAGLCRLSQAPENKIHTLGILPAFQAIYPSCPPALTRNEIFKDKICAILSIVLSDIPVYHLECLPDGDAARLSARWIFEGREA